MPDKLWRSPNPFHSSRGTCGSPGRRTCPGTEGEGRGFSVTRVLWYLQTIHIYVYKYLHVQMPYVKTRMLVMKTRFLGPPNTFKCSGNIFEVHELWNFAPAVLHVHWLIFFFLEVFADAIGQHGLRCFYFVSQAIPGTMGLICWTYCHGATAHANTPWHMDTNTYLHACTDAYWRKPGARGALINLPWHTHTHTQPSDMHINCDIYINA